MKRLLFRVALLVIAALCCVCCAPEPPDPTIPYGLLLKCRDFLTFCLFLADQERPYYSHIAQRYYYAMFSLATIVYQWQKKHGRGYAKIVKHEDVWQSVRHGAKVTYGKDLKELRAKCDYWYDEDSQNEAWFQRELKAVIDKKAFASLCGKVKEDYPKFIDDSYPRGAQKMTECNELMSEIEELNSVLEMKI